MPKNLGNKAKAIAKFVGIATLVGAIAWEGFPPANYRKSNVKEPPAFKKYINDINDVVEKMKKEGLPAMDLGVGRETFKLPPGWEIRPGERIALFTKQTDFSLSPETESLLKKHPNIAPDILYALRSEKPNVSVFSGIDGLLQKHPNIVSENTLRKITELNNRYDTQIKPLIEKHQKIVQRRHLAKRGLFGGFIGTAAAASVMLADARRRLKKQNLSVRRQRK